MSDEAVADHYGSEGLIARIEEQLRALGADPARPRLEDLAAVDEFHTGGRAATMKVAGLLGDLTGRKVIDLGSGLGGPARVIATSCHCHVTGVDLTPDFVAAAEILSERSGLAGQTSFEVGDITALSFAHPTFAAAYTQHTAMNIEAKSTLYAEAARVLESGAPFIVHDILLTEGTAPEAVVYPVPWSRDGRTSFLVDRPTLERHLAAAGFEVLKVADEREGALKGLKMTGEAADDPRRRPNLALFFGELAKEMRLNLIDNLERGRLAPTLLTCRRQG